MWVGVCVCVRAVRAELQSGDLSLSVGVSVPPAGLLSFA